MDAVELEPSLGSSIELTPDQRTDLIAAIARTYPPYRIWWAMGTWYAVGPKPGCGCPHTLHAPDGGTLAELLDAEMAGR